MSKKITKSVVNSAAPKEKDYFLWDRDLKGFGLKVAKGGTKSYVVKYRFGSGRRAPSRRMTIGRHGSPWAPDQARAKANRILGRVANGEDPAFQKQEDKKHPTMAELCDDYIVNGTKTKKPSTIATDKGRIARHIKPLLGRRRVKDIKRKDVRRFMNDVAEGKTAIDVKTGPRGRAIVKGGKGTASRTTGLLGAIFSYAIENDLIETNPARGVKRFPDKKSERFLSQKELVRLGEALNESEANPMAISILKLLIFTGARKGEIESLSWDMVDFDGGYLRLPDSKTRYKIIHMNAGALQVISELTPLEGSDFVFPAVRGVSYFQGTSKIWKQIKKRAGFENVRLHDLRHSFGSIAVSGGASLPMIGALLGHKSTATTQRYAHLQDDPLKTANERVSDSISSAFKTAKSVK
jgi:integrase